MGRGLAIRADITAQELRRLAAKEGSNRTARRMPAIANALDGWSRADGAVAAGMERQALRDAVLRFNAEGVAGLKDKRGTTRPPALTDGELALLAERIYRGPDPEVDGVCSWTLIDLTAWIKERFDKELWPQSLSRILRREGFSRQKTRPVHPKVSLKAQGDFEKRGSYRH
ncbi:MAG: winged helix-turn-helix domain-containing protein [Pseudomonadota bacterium]